MTDRAEAADRRHETGATITVVALLLTVLLAMAALLVDLGLLYQERRELQNGADAAALAVAQDCAGGGCGTYQATAETYADANASDGQAVVDPVTFPTATSVEVVARTADPDGSPGLVRAVFGRVFGREGQQVSARAVASWGSPASGGALPLAISSCEWEDATTSGAVYATGPPFADPTLEYTIYIHDFGTPAGGGGGGGAGGGGGGAGGGGGGTPAQCQFGPGQDIDGDGDRVEGGFGWLDATDCWATVDDQGFVAAEPGNAVPNGCTADHFIDKTVYIPVFDDIPTDADLCPAGSPSNKCYHIIGFAAFHVTGFRFSGAGPLVHNPPCNNPQRCLSGYFLDTVTDWSPGDLGGTDLGVTVVRLAE